MGKKLYVGNLPYGATDQDLLNAFAAVGTVTSAKVIMDRDTGRSKGFGFVELSTDEEAQKAIVDFNGAQMEGRTLTVNEARPPVPRAGGNGGGGRDFGGYADKQDTYAGDRGGNDRGNRRDNRDRDRRW